MTIVTLLYLSGAVKFSNGGNLYLETTQKTLVSIIALATAFIGGDYLDTVEPTLHTHVITEECTVVRQIEKEL